MATKFQQGGQDDQELFSAYLIKLFKPKSQQEFEDTISKLSERVGRECPQPPALS